MSLPFPLAAPTAPLGQVCSHGLDKGLNAFKAIKQGHSKDFTAFKCNLNAFQDKQAQVAVMVLKSPAPTALLPASASESSLLAPVFPVAGLCCSHVLLESQVWGRQLFFPQQAEVLGTSCQRDALAAIPWDSARDPFCWGTQRPVSPQRMLSCSQGLRL